MIVLYQKSAAVARDADDNVLVMRYLKLTPISELKDHMFVWIDGDRPYQFPPTLVAVGCVGLPTLCKHSLKSRFDLAFAEIGRRAGYLTVVLVITVPNIVMFAGTANTPDFMAEGAAAVRTNEFSGKRMTGTDL